MFSRAEQAPPCLVGWPIKAENLILLTATPEQQGKESHFAQLRLLDADRFFDYAEFIKEELEVEPVAQLAKKVVAEHEFNGMIKTIRYSLQYRFTRMRVY